MTLSRLSYRTWLLGALELEISPLLLLYILLSITWSSITITIATSTTSVTTITITTICILQPHFSFYEVSQQLLVYNTVGCYQITRCQLKLGAVNIRYCGTIVEGRVGGVGGKDGEGGEGKQVGEVKRREVMRRKEKKREEKKRGEQRRKEQKQTLKEKKSIGTAYPSPQPPL